MSKFSNRSKVSYRTKFSKVQVSNQSKVKIPRTAKARTIDNDVLYFSHV